MDAWLIALLGLAALVVGLSAYASRYRLWSDIDPTARADGEPPLTPDDELRAEVRVLVERMNGRRAATGLPPLPVEPEIERRLQELRRGSA